MGSTFRIAISVDWVADLTHQHIVFTIVEKLKRVAFNRTQHSYVFTQCSRKRQAMQFWPGRLTTSKMANILVGIFHLYDPDYRIYEDVTNMVS